MDENLYVITLERTKLYKKANKEAVKRHVDYIKNLDDDGRLHLCGLLRGYPGVAGMIIFKAENREEAEKICASEPFHAEGYTVNKLAVMIVANKENNFLLR